MPPRYRAGAVFVTLLFCLAAKRPAPPRPPSLGRQISVLLESSPVAQAAFWGIQIVNLGTGKVVFQMNPDRFFVPASNTKLFTSALALTRLGPDYRFYTTVVAEREPDASGRVSGSLALVGGGDPNLFPRTPNYDVHAFSDNPLQAIDTLAEQVIARGVRRVEGDIVGDDTAYVWAPYPEGWAIDDAISGDGAPVSALAVYDNRFAVSVQPGERPGDPASVLLWPALHYFEIDSRVRTVVGRDRRIRIDREPGSTQLRIWGTIPLGDPGETRFLAIDDPALYAARAFYDALTRRGVTIAGRAVARHKLANEMAALERGRPLPEGQMPAMAGLELARRTSAPFLEDLRVMEKVSQNLHAEMALRAVGRVRRNLGSREAGLEELRTFLQEAGIKRGEYSFTDGSGLSRLNLVTPATVVKLLLYMHNSAMREDWLSLLPVSGEDGTLSKRFEGTPAAGRIRAKTGTLTHITALSGYAEANDGGVLAFSILVNNYNAAGIEVRALVDRICNLMLK